MKKILEVEKVVEGLKSLSDQSRDDFLCSIGNVGVSTIAEYLGVGNSVYSVTEALKVDSAVSVKLTELIKPLESLLGDIKKIVKL